jgi:hypothetical protein
LLGRCFTTLVTPLALNVAYMPNGLLVSYYYFVLQNLLWKLFISSSAI